MSPIYHPYNPSSVFVLDTRTLTEPHIGDVVLRKRAPDSTVEYSLYEGVEDWSANSKTWLLKVFSCPVQYVEDRDPPSGYPRRLKCLMLMVWEAGHGFKEVTGGGILAPEASPDVGYRDMGLGQGGHLPDENSIAMAFAQPCPPLGPTFLKVDFWRDVYFQEEYSQLAVVSVIDTSPSTNNVLRTITAWRRTESVWISGGSVTAPKSIDVAITANEILS